MATNVFSRFVLLALIYYENHQTVEQGRIFALLPHSLSLNKRHAMHAEAMTFHKGSLIIFRTFVKKLGYIKVTDNFCAE